MKKTLIILILAIGLLWLLAAPFVVSRYLDRWVPEWLDDWGLSDSAQFEGGWFRSELKLNDVVDVELTSRHFPPFGLDWVQVDGKLQTALSAMPMTIDGELSLSGASLIDITSSALTFGGPVQMSSDEARLNLNQHLSQPSLLSIELLGFLANDQFGNQIQASLAEIEAGWSSIDDENLALSLALQIETADPLALTLKAEPVQREALFDLIQGLQQFAQTQTDTQVQPTAQQFALLTIAGAWQQLSQNGLNITLEGLELGTGNLFTSDWTTEEGLPLIQGTGSIESLRRSVLPVVGLAAQRPPEDASTLIDAWLDQFSQRGWLTINGERFDFLFAEIAEARSTRP